MGQRRILTLHLLETPNRFFVVPRRPEQCESVVQFLAGGIRSQIERLLEFPDGVRLGGGVFVERLTQVAVLR